jgi:hypothetical protein
LVSSPNALHAKHRQDRHPESISNIYHLPHFLHNPPLLATDDFMKEHENLEKATVPNGMADASSKILSTFFAEKLNLLRDVIEDLKTEVEIRKSMGAEFDQEIEDELKFFESSLRDLLPLGKSGGMSIDKKRIHVEKRIIALKEYRRTHKEKLWHNCVWLKREIFELLQEYKELLKTQEMIA